MTLFELPPLSLYVHIPWCVRKCPYCDFNSWAVRNELDEEAYVGALLADLERELPFVHDRELVSIFIGGGTPSLFGAGAISRLLQGVRQRVPCPSDVEVTLEANPGTLEAGRYAGYRDAGVNRLSIGVQSFHGESLQRLGRIHGPGEALAAVEAARATGFDNLNLDLMFGLPGRGVEQALADVRQAIDLAPWHLSYYQLTLEPDTPFFRAPPALPEDDLLWEIHCQGQALLAEAGYAHYEVSAYALPGRECRHNLNYWTFGDYLGIGAGAHGKVSDPEGRIVRRCKPQRPGAYLRAMESGEGAVEQQILARQDLAVEFMMNALRLRQGFGRALFEQRTGLPIGEIQARMDEAVAAGLLEVSGERVWPSGRGWLFLNDLLAMFLPDAG
jgi:oxygen-independent coproporphyrinogen-3 oxidase